MGTLENWMWTMVRESLDFVFGQCLASQLEKGHQEGQRWFQRDHTSHIIPFHPLSPVILHDFCSPVIWTTGRVQSTSFSFTCAAQNLHLKDGIIYFSYLRIMFVSFSWNFRYLSTQQSLGFLLCLFLQHFCFSCKIW